MMPALPSFLSLLKSNVLLYSIITHSSFTQLDLSLVEHTIRTKNFAELRNISLGEDEMFTSVNVMLMDEGVSLVFHTANSKYFDYPERYFQRMGVESHKAPYTLYGQEVQTQKKKLGNFPFSGPSVPPASVEVRKSSVYGYVISVNFYRHNML